MEYRIFLFLWSCCVPAIMWAQEAGYKVEAQSSWSDRVTPLWLNANKYGLSSLERSNGYFLAGVEKRGQHFGDSEDLVGRRHGNGSDL
ncbi:MAG: hypothetical protein LKE68_06020 [Prevotella sp.]|nr:hypothetical protein [Prevotella sp.]MCH3992155.1 hypothetical protein [Prevotella sp.]